MNKPASTNKSRRALAEVFKDAKAQKLKEGADEYAALPLSFRKIIEQSAKVKTGQRLDRVTMSERRKIKGAIFRLDKRVKEVNEILLKTLFLDDI